MNKIMTLVSGSSRALYSDDEVSSGENRVLLYRAGSFRSCEEDLHVQIQFSVSLQMLLSSEDMAWHENTANLLTS